MLIFPFSITFFLFLHQMIIHGYFELLLEKIDYFKLLLFNTIFKETSIAMSDFHSKFV